MLLKVETLLPLGKVDPGLRKPEKSYDLKRIFEDSATVESLGYDGIMFEETKHDPFIASALAAQSTSRINIGTAVAMAFPRSPTIVAMSAWNIQKISNGRFILGLGSQVKGHVERRFGMKWSPPGPWLKEYVLAVKEIWSSWQESRQPKINGKFYNINLSVPLFDPGPIENSNIPIHLAAVNKFMTRVAGCVADGVRPHPVCTPSYIREIMEPEIEIGLETSSNKNREFSIAIKPLIATGATTQELEKAKDIVKARIAFYGATRAYRAAFEFNELNSLADQLGRLAKEKKWDEMPHLISDEVLFEYACVGLHDEIAGVVKNKYQDIVTNVEFSLSENHPFPQLKQVIARLQSN